MFDVTITDESGLPLCVFDRLLVARHGFSRAAVNKRYDVVYERTGLVLPVDGTHFLMPAAASSPLTGRRELLHTTDGDDITDTHTSSSGSSSSGDWEDTTFSTDVSSERGGDKASSLIIDYVRGEEMKLQAPLAALDPRENVSLLFVAQDGLNGSAALGFTRSLRKEYPAWTVRVAVFDTSLTKAQQIRCADVLASLPGTDLEMTVDKEGAVHVPRITLTSAPSEHVPFDSKLPWMLQDGDVTLTHTPRAFGEKRVVEVAAVHPHGDNVWAFAGTLQGSSQAVVGLTSSSICSHLEVHEGSIVEYDGKLSAPDFSGPSILAPTIAALLVGPTTLAHPARLRGKRALIYVPTSVEDKLARDVQSVLSRLGMETALLRSLEGSKLQSHYARKPHFVAAWACDRSQMTVLQSLVSSPAHAFFWNDPEVGIAKVLVDDPWVVGDAVRAALKYNHRQQRPKISYTPLLAILGSISPNKTARLPPLFDPHKAYLLVGGIGSLGLHIALWMYDVSTHKCCQQAPY